MTRLFLGLAVGSGGAGIDAALVEAIGTGNSARFRVRRAARLAFPPEYRPRAPLDEPFVDPADAAHAHRALAESAAHLAVRWLHTAQVSPDRLSAAGWMGPSAVGHEPAGPSPSSHEFGMASLIAARLGVTTVSDFRASLVHQGDGRTPVTAPADRLLFSSPEGPRVLLHLGAHTSVVALPTTGELGGGRAWEVGPGGKLLAAAMRRATRGREAFDAGGRWAVQGRRLDGLMELWAAHPAVTEAGRRGVSRLEFGREFLDDAVRRVRRDNGTLEDLLCTLCHLIAETAVASIRRELPELAGGCDAFLSGGATANGFLWRLLERAWPEGRLKRLNELGVAATARSAASAGVFAALFVDQVPVAWPGLESRLWGRVTPGDPLHWAESLAWMAARAEGAVRFDRAA